MSGEVERYAAIRRTRLDYHAEDALYDYLCDHRDVMEGLVRGFIEKNDWMYWGPEIADEWGDWSEDEY